jgi:hypothetical protein
METKARQSRRWPCLEFSLVDVHKPEAVAEFIIWLCTGHYRDDWKGPDASSREIDEEDLLETLWSWDNAPRQRMAKLLWQLLVGNDSSEHFSQFFTIDEVWLTRQAKDCQKILGRIHKKLRWVLDGFMERKQQDVSIGQSRWGEEWLLPPKHTAYVQKRLRRAHPDLLQESSSYEDSLGYFTRPYFEQACSDDNRHYIGERDEQWHVRVWIEDSLGKTYPLEHATFPFRHEPGTNFAWGYCGSGPADLSHSILADAAHGNLEIAKRLRIPFRDEVISSISWDGNFKLSLRAVLKWLGTQGVGQKQLDDALAQVDSLKAEFGSGVEAHKTRVKEIQRIGGLLAQRFDIVPPDFESALYVDLMHMFERAGSVLRCARCRQPVPCDQSPRGNRQRARWSAGKSIYHEKCFVEHRREHKRSYWHRLSNNPAFQATERDRGRKRRKRKSTQQKRRLQSMEALNAHK